MVNSSSTKRMISAQLEDKMIHKIMEIQKKQILRTGKNASRNSIVVMLLEFGIEEFEKQTTKG